MNKVAKATISLMIVTILSKVLGFMRELVLASFYGTSIYSDAYLIALNIPTVIFAAIGTAISTTFIPIYYESDKIGGKVKCNKFTNNVLNIAFILSLILSVVGFIFTDQLVKLFAIGFEGDTLKLTIDFTRILIFGIIFTSISEVIKGYLNANNNFSIPGIMSGVPFNIMVIVAIILSAKINPYILPVGTLIAISSRFIFQIPFAYKYGYKYKSYINIKDEDIKKMIWLLGPVFIGVAVNQVNTMIDRTLASTLAVGSISALNYANRLNAFVLGVFITSIASVIYPMLSKLSSDDDKDNFCQSIVKSVNIVILLIIPISVGAIVLCNPIVKLLFQRGAFDLNATNMTSIALAMYSIGMIGFGLRDILGKVFYSLQDTKTPMINGAISMVMNILFNLVLVRYMGHSGLALGTSISSIICIILLFYSLKKKIGYFGEDKIIKVIIKSLIAASIMGIITFHVYGLLNKILGIGSISEIISLLGSISIGAITYAIMTIILKVEEISIITSMVKKKLKI